MLDTCRKLGRVTGKVEVRPTHEPKICEALHFVPNIAFRATLDDHIELTLFSNMASESTDNHAWHNSALLNSVTIGYDIIHRTFYGLPSSAAIFRC